MEGSEVTVVGKETKDTIIPEILLPTGTEVSYCLSHK